MVTNSPPAGSRAGYLPALYDSIASKVDATNGQSSGLSIAGGIIDTTTTIPVSGSSPRALSNKVNDIISVKDFGAVGDGTTDDTAAINAALSSGPSEIFFPVGNYYCTGTVSIPSGVRAFGAGFSGPDSPNGTTLSFNKSVLICVQCNGTGFILTVNS